MRYRAISVSAIVGEERGERKRGKKHSWNTKE